MTKLELQQALAERNTQLNAARLRIAELEGDVMAAKAQVLRVTKPVFVRREPVVTPEQLDYRMRARAAREAAVSSGRSVLV